MKMTVEHLINELQKVENKKQRVWIYAGEWTNEFAVIQDDDFIRLDDPYEEPNEETK